MAAFSSRGRRFLGGQHAIHAKSHAEFLLERFDVDVARPFFERIGNHGVHEANHRRFAGHVAQVLEIGQRLLVSAVPGQHLALAVGVMLVHRVDDFLLGRQRRLNLQTGKRSDRGRGFEVHRVGHGDRQHGAVQRHRKRARLTQETVRQPFDLRRRGRRPVNRHQRHVQLFAQRRQHVALRHQPHIHQDFAQLVAALTLQFERALQVLGFDLPALDQHLAQPLEAQHAHGGRCTGLRCEVLGRH